MHFTLALFISKFAQVLGSVLNSRTAYLDPGSGSFILQLIIASLLGALFIVRAYWQKIRDFFRNLFNRRGGDRQE